MLLRVCKLKWERSHGCQVIIARGHVGVMMISFKRHGHESFLQLVLTYKSSQTHNACCISAAVSAPWLEQMFPGNVLVKCIVCNMSASCVDANARPTSHILGLAVHMRTSVSCLDMSAERRTRSLIGS